MTYFCKICNAVPAGVLHACVGQPSVDPAAWAKSAAAFGAKPVDPSLEQRVAALEKEMREHVHPVWEHRLGGLVDSGAPKMPGVGGGFLTEEARAMGECRVPATVPHGDNSLAHDRDIGVAYKPAPSGIPDPSHWTLEIIFKRFKDNPTMSYRQGADLVIEAIRDGKVPGIYAQGQVGPNMMGIEIERLKAKVEKQDRELGPLREFHGCFKPHDSTTLVIDSEDPPPLSGVSSRVTVNKWLAAKPKGDA